MLAGASAASTMIGSVVEDVEMAVGASSGAAFALEMTIASACVTVQKSHVLVCRVVRTGVLRLFMVPKSVLHCKKIRLVTRFVTNDWFVVVLRGWLRGLIPS